MKAHVEQMIWQALRHLEIDGDLPAIPAYLEVMTPKEPKHGDYVSNVALVIAKLTHQSALDIANLLLAHMPSSPYLRRVEVAGAGFLNFYLADDALHDVIKVILSQKDNYGTTDFGRGKRILLEFLSSKPTGPLHVGHGRHAVYGSTLAKLLRAVGFSVYTEYYVNDDLPDMHWFVLGVWCQYLRLSGVPLNVSPVLPSGKPVQNIAKAIYAAHQSHFVVTLPSDWSNAIQTSQDEVDDETQAEWISMAMSLLGDRYQSVYDLCFDNVMADIREDLVELGVQYDNWVLARQLIQSGMVDDTIEQLIDRGHTYVNEGAIWLRTTDFGDDKDRLLKRRNGTITPFAVEIAYHYSKFDRGFDIAIDVFGVDHQAYFNRSRAGMRAMGVDAERIVDVVMQRVCVYQGDEKVNLSKRCDDALTLRALRHWIGKDALRFFYLMKKPEQAIEIEKSPNEWMMAEHPIHYIQYAHMRIDGILKQCDDRLCVFDEAVAFSSMHLLSQQEEHALLHCLMDYPDMVYRAAITYDPTLLVKYLKALSTAFHAYYAHYHLLSESEALRQARLGLMLAVKQVLDNAFQLLTMNVSYEMESTLSMR